MDAFDSLVDAELRELEGNAQAGVGGIIVGGVAIDHNATQWTRQPDGSWHFARSHNGERLNPLEYGQPTEAEMAADVSSRSLPSFGGTSTANQSIAYLPGESPQDDFNRQQINGQQQSDAVGKKASKTAAWMFAALLAYTVLYGVRAARK